MNPYNFIPIVLVAIALAGYGLYTFYRNLCQGIGDLNQRVEDLHGELKTFCAEFTFKAAEDSVAHFKVLDSKVDRLTLLTTGIEALVIDSVSAEIKELFNRLDEARLDLANLHSLLRSTDAEVIAFKDNVSVALTLIAQATGVDTSGEIQEGVQNV